MLGQARTCYVCMIHSGFNFTYRGVMGFSIYGSIVRTFSSAHTHINFLRSWRQLRSQGTHWRRWEMNTTTSAPPPSPSPASRTHPISLTTPPRTRGPQSLAPSLFPGFHLIAQTPPIPALSTGTGGGARVIEGRRQWACSLPPRL